MLFTQSSKALLIPLLFLAQSADLGSLADSGTPSSLLHSPFFQGAPFCSVVCQAGTKHPPPTVPHPCSPCPLWRQQDKFQTETLKDFWTLAQWADSVRRWWLASASRPPPGLHPPFPTPALANSCQPWPAGIPPRVWVWKRDEGRSQVFG